MKAWFKAFGIVVWYTTTQTAVAIGVCLWKIFQIGDDVEISAEMLETAISDSTYVTLAVAGVMAILPFLPGLIKNQGKDDERILIIRRIGARRLLFLVSAGISLDALSEVATSAIPILAKASDQASVIDTYSAGDFWLSLLSTAIIVPVVEEFLFRYKVCTFFREKPRHYATVAAAIVFGCAHISIVQAMYAFAAGLILGFVYEKNGNLTENIVFHASINAATILAIAMGKKFGETGEAACCGIAALACVICVCLLIDKILRERPYRSEERKGGTAKKCQN